jgi:pyruvate dehydrogenase (quinone)/pyruvate oxidase
MARTTGKPGEVRPALEAAFAANKPAIVEAIVDPFEPPMPARATRQQALRLAESLVRGEPEGGKLIATMFKDRVKELV